MKFECGELESLVVDGEEYVAKDGIIELPERFAKMDYISAHGIKPLKEEKKPEAQKRK